jgi:hypothetical protein
MQAYFMYANHRYIIIKRGFISAKEADNYSRKHYGGFPQYHKMPDGEYVLGQKAKIEMYYTVK